MVSHTCEECGKSFNRKSNYDYHINKKKTCKSNEITTKNVIPELTVGRSRWPQGGLVP